MKLKTILCNSETKEVTLSMSATQAFQFSKIEKLSLSDGTGLSIDEILSNLITWLIENVYMGFINSIRP